MADKENLERKISFSERAKYFALPALLTLGAYFGPNMHRRYESISEEKQERYKRMLLIGTALAGTAVTAVSGIKIYKDYKTRKENGKENANAYSKQDQH